jgi:gliding motility-associated-like protein
MHKNYLLLLLLLICSRVATSQIIGTNVFLKGSRTEVGISNCGSFGTSAPPTASLGYHNNVPGRGLGFVADAGRNGWTVAGPAPLPNYCGDYFLPGSPVEGFGVQIGTANFRNFNNSTICELNQTPGTILCYQNTPQRKSATWRSTGLVSGALRVSATTYVPDTALFFVTQVQLCNESAVTQRNVYYLRHLDPDNDQPWAGGSFTTDNTVVSQGSSTTPALVTAYSLLRCYLSLGTESPNARVSVGGFAPPALSSDVYNGIAPYNTTVGYNSRSDEAISLCFKFDSILPGQCVCFGYAHVLNPVDLNRALALTSAATSFFSDTNDITDSLKINICYGDTSKIKAVSGCASTYTWNWSADPPGSIIGPTTYDSIRIAPLVNTVYTALTSGTCGVDTYRVIVTVDTLLKNARISPIDTTVCLGASVNITSTGGSTYAWSPGGDTTSSIFVSPLTRTIYSLTMSSPFRCRRVFTSTINIDTIRANAGLDDSLCPGRTLTIGGSPTTTGSGFPTIWTAFPASVSSYLSSTTVANPVVTIPSTALAGNIGFKVTSSRYGCTASDSIGIRILTAPPIDFTGLDSIYCVSDPPNTLIGLPSGGVFSGTGILGTSFSPPIAGIGGPRKVTYTYTFPNGCIGVDSAFTYIDSIPRARFSGLANRYCVNESFVTLTGIPSGGIFSGTGIIGNQFHPSIAGVGTRNITYTYTNPVSGCVDDTVISTVVNPRPTLSITSLDSIYCELEPADTIIGLPSGGVFSGPGISGNLFTPALAGTSGRHTIYYNFTSPTTGCSNIDSAFTYVSAIPTAGIAGLSTNYCIYDPIDTLVGTPAGGTFSGPGISGTTFNPATAGIGGPHRIIYYYFNPVSGCNNADTQFIYVRPRPTVSFSGLSTQYCSYDSAITLVGNPTGGVFSGLGIIPTNRFSPITAGVSSSINIIYLYADTFGCINTDTNSTRVNPRPTISFSGLDSQYCFYNSSVVLTGIPSGGTFSGTGISGNNFSPSTAGIGTHFIKYSFTDPTTGCINIDSQRVVINNRPIIDFTGLASIYCIHASSSTLTGIPVGGTFSGVGISGSSFNPATAGIGGPYLITYSYTSPTTGCSNIDSQFVRVLPRPVVSFSGLSSQYCSYDSSVVLIGSPVGGVFSGTGIIPVNRFSPTTAGVNPSIDIYYTYTDSFGCINYDTNTTRVNARPLVDFTGLDSQYCFYNPSVTLTGIPIGGIFSGNGIIGSSFNPSSAGFGAHFIKYTYTDPLTGCVNIDSQRVFINSRPIINFTGLASRYCIDATPASLTGTPAGGAFSGIGISGSVFNPSVAGVGGPYAIIYNYTSPSTGCNSIDTGYVSVDSLPNPTFSGLNNQYCFYSTDVTLVGSPSGGTFSGTGISGSTFSPSTAGIGGPYRIIYTYTDPTTGCTGRDTQFVTITGRPAITISGLARKYCINAPSATITVTPSGGWFTGVGLLGNVFTPASAGVGGPYDIVYYVIDSTTGCFSKDSLTTSVYALPIADFTGLNTSYCVNASPATLTGIPSGGVFSGTGVVGSTFNPATAGVGGPYSVRYFYTDTNGCTDDTIKNTIVNPLPIANAGPDDTICFGGSTMLTASGGNTYAWSPGGGTTSSIFVAPSTNTTYTVTVTDINNCSASDNVTISVKIITSNISKTNITCYRYKNGTATVTPTNGIPPYSYIWSDSRGQITQTADSLDIGTYTVTITDGEGCTGINTIIITEPTLFTVNVSSTDVLCGGDSTGTVTLIGSGGTLPYSYSFTKDSSRYYTNPNTNNLTVGNYVGYALDGNGCRVDYSFIISEPEPLSMQYKSNMPRCYGYNDGSLFVLATGATAPYTFNLNNFSNNTGWFTDLAAGVYNLNIVDDNNCPYNYEITLLQPDPVVVDINPDTLILELGETGQFFTSYTGAPVDSVSFEWNTPSGLNCTDCPNPVVSAYVDKVYTVKVYDISDVSNPNPCMGEAIGYVFVSDGIPIYIPNAFTPNNDGENDKFYVYGNDLKVVHMMVYDRWGEMLFESSRQDNGWDGTYKGVAMNPGVYIYKVEAEYLNGKRTSQSGSITLMR